MPGIPEDRLRLADRIRPLLRAVNEEEGVPWDSIQAQLGGIMSDEALRKFATGESTPFARNLVAIERWLESRPEKPRRATVADRAKSIARGRDGPERFAYASAVHLGRALILAWKKGAFESEEQVAETARVIAQGFAEEGRSYIEEWIATFSRGADVTSGGGSQGNSPHRKHEGR